MSAMSFLAVFMRWLIVAAVTGIIGGLVGSAFNISVTEATAWRTAHSYIVFLLPVGGIVIVTMYKLAHMVKNKGTNDIIESVRTDGNIPLRTAPLIFVSTVITHFFGGSAGREGAALQLGGSIGSWVGRLFRLDEKDKHIVVMCGMSAVFSALFGTPLTAILFSLEVVSVGVMYYSALIPCSAASLVAYGITLYFNLEPTHFELAYIPALGPVSIAQTAFIAMLCALLSIIFCMLLHTLEKGFKTYIKNDYLRIVIGGVMVVAMTMLVGCGDYNGTGTALITSATQGSAKPEAFLLKMLFTAVTIGAGYKGGEIVPTFFVGATFGCTVAGLIGMDPGFGAALGMVGLFCGMLNCPVASIILSIELFGQQGLILFAITAGVSYMLSGYYGLYHSQKIVYSKVKAEYINKTAKEVL
ncbi:MAG: chloride channel protein [Clostridiales bacterium]|nr:chloride channel protein [Clostridiales bacterium]